MEDEKFEELIESVREGIAIISGEKVPCRSFHIESDNAQTMWNKIQVFFHRIFESNEL